MSKKSGIAIEALVKEIDRLHNIIAEKDSYIIQLLSQQQQVIHVPFADPQPYQPHHPITCDGTGEAPTNLNDMSTVRPVGDTLCDMNPADNERYSHADQVDMFGCLADTVIPSGLLHKNVQTPIAPTDKDVIDMGDSSVRRNKPVMRNG